MKNTYSLRHFFLLSLIAILLAACGQEQKEEFVEVTAPEDAPILALENSSGAASTDLLDAAFGNARLNGDQIEGRLVPDDVNPELLQQLMDRQRFTLESDYMVSPETVERIYGGAGMAPPFSGGLGIPADDYDVYVVQGLIIIHIHIETADYVLDIYIIIDC